MNKNLCNLESPMNSTTLSKAMSVLNVIAFCHNHFTSIRDIFLRLERKFRIELLAEGSRYLILQRLYPVSIYTLLDQLLLVQIKE